MTLTISDTYGFGDGNLAAGRMRVALFGSLERITDVEESKKCRKAYLQGGLRVLRRLNGIFAEWFLRRQLTPTLRGPLEDPTNRTLPSSLV
jgi:hypothetical protein